MARINPFRCLSDQFVQCIMQTSDGVAGPLLVGNIILIHGYF